MSKDLDNIIAYAWEIRTLNMLTKKFFETEPILYNYVRFLYEIKLIYEHMFVEKWHKPTKNQTKVRVRTYGRDLLYSKEIKRVLSYIDEWELYKGNIKGLDKFRKTLEDMVADLEITESKVYTEEDLEDRIKKYLKKVKKGDTNENND